MGKWLRRSPPIDRALARRRRRAAEPDRRTVSPRSRLVTRIGGTRETRGPSRKAFDAPRVPQGRRLARGQCRQPPIRAGRPYDFDEFDEFDDEGFREDFDDYHPGGRAGHPRQNALLRWTRSAMRSPRFAISETDERKAPGGAAAAHREIRQGLGARRGSSGRKAIARDGLARLAEAEDGDPRVFEEPATLQDVMTTTPRPPGAARPWPHSEGRRGSDRRRTASWAVVGPTPRGRRLQGPGTQGLATGFASARIVPSRCAGLVRHDRPLRSGRPDGSWRLPAETASQLRRASALPRRARHLSRSPTRIEVFLLTTHLRRPWPSRDRPETALVGARGHSEAEREPSEAESPPKRRESPRRRQGRDGTTRCGPDRPPGRLRAPSAPGSCRHRGGFEPSNEDNRRGRDIPEETAGHSVRVGRRSRRPSHREQDDRFDRST